MTELKQFPDFALGVLIALVKAVLSDVEVFLIFILGILIGFASDPLTGASIALGYYILFRMGSHYAMLYLRSRGGRRD